MQLDLLFLWVVLLIYFYHKYWQLAVHGKKSKMFCSAMRNNCYNECIVMYLGLYNNVSTVKFKFLSNFFKASWTSSKVFSFYYN